MFDSSLYGPGWSGMPAIATTPAGAVGTTAATATAGNPDAGPGAEVAAAMASCTLCQNPLARQALFFAAVIFLAVAWHSHLRSMLE